MNSFSKISILQTVQALVAHHLPIEPVVTVPTPEQNPDFNLFIVRLMHFFQELDISVHGFYGFTIHRWTAVHRDALEERTVLEEVSRQSEESRVIV